MAEDLETRLAMAVQGTRTGRLTCVAASRGAGRSALNPNVNSDSQNYPPLGTLIEVDVVGSQRPRKYTWRGRVHRYFEAEQGKLGLVVSDGSYYQHLWPGSVEYRVVRYPGEEFDCEHAKWRLV